MTPPRPPPRPNRGPIIAGDEQPARGSVHHPGVDGSAQPEPRRSPTLTRLPFASGETADTLPAPSTTAVTVAAPPPTSLRIPLDQTLPEAARGSLPPPSQRPELAVAEALRRRAEAAEKRAQEAERALRVRQEAQLPGPFQPPLVRRDSPPPSSRESKPPGKGDWAKLRYKLATAVVAALVLVIGALGLWVSSAISAKTEAIKAAQEEKRKADGQLEKWRSWASVVTWIEDCRDKRDVESGEMLRPSAEKMGAARKLEAWQNHCPDKLPPPP